MDIHYYFSFLHEYHAYMLYVQISLNRGAEWPHSPCTYHGEAWLTGGSVSQADDECTFRTKKRVGWEKQGQPKLRGLEEKRVSLLPLEGPKRCRRTDDRERWMDQCARSYQQNVHVSQNAAPIAKNGDLPIMTMTCSSHQGKTEPSILIIMCTRSCEMTGDIVHAW